MLVFVCDDDEENALRIKEKIVKDDKLILAELLTKF